MIEASTKYIGRFAPSPTGPLHFGSLVAAVASYLDARANGGDWLLRIEDIDTSRCKAEFANEFPAVLSAFGFAWNGEVLVQSKRIQRYQEAFDRLAIMDQIYACSCSRREIADSSLPGTDGLVYPGTCRCKGLAAAGNSQRIRTNADETCFRDRVQGRHCQRIENDIGDFVLRRRDGLFAYQLAVVVDDADQNISHVVRGADLLDSTARQLYLQGLLGFRKPSYLHIPVVTNADGQKLSKQTLAPMVSTADACRLLRDALRHLGQPDPAPEHDKPAALLKAAADAWSISFIPALRAIQGP